LFVEHSINTILLESMPGSDPLLREIEFSDRAEIARKLKLFDDPGIIRTIRVLTKIRNDFAHNLSRDSLTRDDDEELLNSIKGTNLGADFQAWYKREANFDSRPGAISRQVLIVLVVHLSSLEGSLRHQPRNLESALEWYGISEAELLRLTDQDDV
jgi:hypothetical protein